MGWFEKLLWPNRQKFAILAVLTLFYYLAVFVFRDFWYNLLPSSLRPALTLAWALLLLGIYAALGWDIRVHLRAHLSDAALSAALFTIPFSILDALLRTPLGLYTNC